MTPDLEQTKQKNPNHKKYGSPAALSQCALIFNLSKEIKQPNRFTGKGLQLP